MTIALGWRYLDDTLVVETTVRTAGGEARVIDCFAMREGGKTDPHRQLLRIVEGARGSMELSLRVAPRLDYGEVRLLSTTSPPAR